MAPGRPRDPRCRRVPPQAIYDLRMRVVIAGTDRLSVEFEGDEDPATIHYGLYDPDLVACASLMRVPWDGTPAFQLRGMATETASQGQGFGRRLLEAIEADLIENERERMLWCNARATAVGFYERMGWTVAGEPFEIPGVGPHQQLVRRLAQGAL